MTDVTSSIPLGAVLLDGDGMFHVVEPDEHLARAVDGHLVCVRPTHAGKSCRIALADLDVPQVT